MNPKMLIPGYFFYAAYQDIKNLTPAEMGFKHIADEKIKEKDPNAYLAKIAYNSLRSIRAGADYFVAGFYEAGTIAVGLFPSTALYNWTSEQQLGISTISTAAFGIVTLAGWYGLVRFIPYKLEEVSRRSLTRKRQQYIDQVKATLEEKVKDEPKTDSPTVPS